MTERARHMVDVITDTIYMNKNIGRSLGDLVEDLTENASDLYDGPYVFCMAIRDALCGLDAMEDMGQTYTDHDVKQRIAMALWRATSDISDYAHQGLNALNADIKEAYYEADSDTFTDDLLLDLLTQTDLMVKTDLRAQLRDDRVYTLKGIHDDFQKLAGLE